AGIRFIAIPPDALDGNFAFDDGFIATLEEYSQAFGSNLYLGASFLYSGDDQKKLFRLAQIGDRLGIPLIALNDVHYHDATRRQLQDVLTCIRTKCTIHTVGFRL